MNRIIRSIKARSNNLIQKMIQATESHCIILAWHSIYDRTLDPDKLSVPPDLFREQLNALKKSYTILPLATALRLARQNSLPHGSICLTFDDGYADNLHNAYPHLNALACPATIAIATDYLEKRSFWWDLLAYNTTQPDDLKRYQDWTANIKTLPPAERQEWILAQHFQEELVPTDLRPLKVSELKELATSPLIEIASHGHSHSSFGVLDPVASLEELQTSKNILQRFNNQVHTLVLPYGDSQDSPMSILNLSSIAGLDNVVSNIQGTMTHRSSLMPRRILVRAEDPSLLIHRLERLFHPLRSSIGL